MGIDGLEEAQCDPYVNSEDVEVPHEVAVQQRSGNGSSSKDEYLSWVRVFSCKTERCGVLVMYFVDVLIQRTGMQSLVSCEADEI